MTFSWDAPSVLQLDGEDVPLPVNSFSSVAETFRLVKAGWTILYGCTMTNANVGTRWLQGFDATALPANGAVPVFSIHAATGTEAGLSYSPTGRAFKSGCLLAISTTQNSLTIGGADAIFDAQYV
jgi:hypothetical protein